MVSRRGEAREVGQRVARPALTSTMSCRGPLRGGPARLGAAESVADPKRLIAEGDSFAPRDGPRHLLRQRTSRTRRVGVTSEDRRGPAVGPRSLLWDFVNFRQGDAGGVVHA